MLTRPLIAIRRQLAILAAIITTIVLFETLVFNRYFFSYSLLHLQPQRLSLQSGLLHDFEAVDGKLIALSSDPNVTFPHVDARVQRIALSCKNAKPGASGRVYFAAGNTRFSEGSAIGYATAQTLYNRILDLPIGQTVTALRFDLTDVKGDHVACADILINPAASFRVARSRLAIYAVLVLAAIAITLRGSLQDMAMALPGRVRHALGVLMPNELSAAQWVIITILALLAGGSAYWRASTLDPVLYSYGHGNGSVGPGYRTTDMWFNANVPQMMTTVSDRNTYYDSIVSEHPLLPLATYPPVTLLGSVVGLSTIEAVRVYWAALAALWTVLLFLLLRVIGYRTMDATVFTVLATTSAAFIFWFVVPESFSVGSLTILMAIYLAAVAHRSKSPVWTYLVVNFLSLSMTLTNWMLGILAAILNLPWRRALVAIVGGFLVTALLWGVQKQFFPTASFFLGSSGRLTESIHVPPSADRILEVIGSFLSDTVVMPQIRVYKKLPFQRVMTTEGPIPGSGGPFGYAAAVAWLVLLGLGVWGCLREWPRSSVTRLVVLTAAGQMGLTFVFGVEPFLYAMHFLPLLIVIAAAVTRTRLRPVGVGLAILVAVLCLVNNQMQFGFAVEFLKSMAKIAAGS